MDEHAIVRRNLARQRELYGEPLGDRLRRLVVAFDVSQTRLAQVLGISAPMLSQVMSGRRVKIGNPVVLSRLVMLELAAPLVTTPEAARNVLDEVGSSSPSLFAPGFLLAFGRNRHDAAA